eukprot:SAG31_NODE_879_length_11292_cov_49.116680_7_plen_36_part_00
MVDAHQMDDFLHEGQDMQVGAVSHSIMFVLTATMI